MSESIWNDPRITAYVLGELEDEERAKFEQELASNPDLMAAVDETRSLTDQLRSHFASEHPAGLDADRREAILAVAAEPEPTAGDSRTNADSRPSVKTQPSGGSWWRHRGWQLAIAASLVIVIVGLSQPSLQSHRRVTQSFERAMENVFGESQEATAGRQDPQIELESTVDALRYSHRSEQLDELAIDPAPAAIEPQSEALGFPVEKLARDANALSSTSAPRMLAPMGPSPGPFPASTEGEANWRMLDSDRFGRNGNRLIEGIIVTDEARRPASVPADEVAEGRGPGMAGDRFEPITDNPFKRVSEHPLSTFSVDVDTASYSKLRDVLIRTQSLPRPDAVRIEEMVNYFDYAYEPSAADSEHPLAARVEIVACPWNESHRLARVAIKGRTIASESQPAKNLVFLIDTSGSMNAPNRLPLVLEGMRMLLTKLNPHDRVAIVTYAGSAGLVLDSTPASKLPVIREAIDRLRAGGSTNGGAGIHLAYQTARDHFLPGGVNRVILCTDGDFNVGVTGTDELVRVVEQQAQGGVFLTVLGFGMGNHNDAMLEQISGRGNGNYAFIDTQREARKVLVQQVDATLVTIAKDVKLQLEFNPQRVAAYRLIGYENRVLAKEDFNDDKKDAGEVGAGHAVTAFYELIPAGAELEGLPPAVDDLKYQTEVRPNSEANQDETLTVKIRYKAPDGDVSQLVEFPVVDGGKTFTEADDDLRFAAAVAGLGMKLRRSPYAGNWTFSDISRTASGAIGGDPHGLRAEFLYLNSIASQAFGEVAEPQPAAAPSLD